MVSAPSGLSPRELIGRAVEECEITIFLNEWLEALGDADERLIASERPGYADAPALTHDEMRSRLDEIARINCIEGTRHWLTPDEAWDGRVERRGAPDRRARRPAASPGSPWR